MLYLRDFLNAERKEDYYAATGEKEVRFDVNDDDDDDDDEEDEDDDDDDDEDEKKKKKRRRRSSSVRDRGLRIESRHDVRDALAPLRRKLLSGMDKASLRSVGSSLAASFKAMDRDGDGFLSAKELRKALRKLGVKVTMLYYTILYCTYY